MAKSKKPKPAESTRFEGETFKGMGSYDLDNLIRYWPAPSCINGTVHVRRWRVVIEQIEEPDEVIAARILKLWRECDNHHHWAPLQWSAAEVGLTLDHADMGVDRPARGRE